MIPFPIDCNGCELRALHSGTYGFSLLEGDGSSGLLVSAEALGDWEERDGLPLRPWAPSGRIFQRALDERSIRRDSLTITNIVRCKPPGNELRGASYERAAIDHCQRYFDRAVRERQPRAILALGDIPFRELTGYSGITAHRGFILPSRYEGVPCIGTYHPAFLLRGAMHLFGVFMRDVQLAVDVARNGVPAAKECTYALDPTDADIHDFLDYVRSDVGRPIAYDIETAGILGEAKPAELDRDAIIQVQFSAAAGTALVLDFTTARGREAVRTILALENAKWGWNNRLFDEPLLRRAGYQLAGEQHDLLNVWLHLQPSFGTGKDAGGGSDKAVPSMLGGLQSCASFYCPEIRPWKGAVERAVQTLRPGEPISVGVMRTLREYGASDADITYRCGTGLFESLRGAGLDAGYRVHKYELCAALDEISAHGLPIDRTKQAELRAYTTGELDRLVTSMQDAVPAELRAIHPKAGYKKAKYQLGEFVRLKSAAGIVVERQFGDVTRQCLLKPFNPGAAPQVLAYIKHQGYPVPRKIDDPEKETTGKSELEKLAAEVNDPVLNAVVAYRQLRKTGMDYTSGKWEPAADGRVHGTFRPNTASGQLTCSDPNQQQFPEHSQLAKRAKEMIAAEPGHTLVKIDMRGFHSRSIGWIAGDAAYYKLADFDVHSFLAAHFLRLQGADYLLELPDDELREELSIIKRLHSYVRNYKCKRVIHGSQFGLGVNKLYRMYERDFESRAEAQALKDLLARLFPQTFTAFPRWVERRIKVETPGVLYTPFGTRRFFYDHDMEQATAFLPSNYAHCEFQRAKIRLHKSGALRRYGCCNTVHDSLWFHCPDALVEACIEETVGQLTRPSDILVAGALGPFQCNADVERGKDLAHMK